jgi:hypothetical protein
MPGDPPTSSGLSELRLVPGQSEENDPALQGVSLPAIACPMQETACRGACGYASPPSNKKLICLSSRGESFLLSRHPMGVLNHSKIPTIAISFEWMTV